MGSNPTPSVFRLARGALGALGELPVAQVVGDAAAFLVLDRVEGRIKAAEVVDGYQPASGAYGGELRTPPEQLSQEGAGLLVVLKCGG